MANVVVGSLVANELVATAAKPAGSLNFGPFSVPKGYTVLMVSYDLRQVNSLTAVLSAALELSLDSGQSWASMGGATLSLPDSGYELSGGVLVRSQIDPMGPGAPVRIFAKQLILRNAHLTTRQLRGTLSISEGLVTGVTLAGW